MRGWRRILSDMLTPSAPDESAYLWMLLAIGHAVAGAALAQAMPAAVPQIAVPLAYGVLKELHDLRHGGRLADGLVDTAFVALGLLYGAWWWPALVLGAAVAGALVRPSEETAP